MKKDDDVFLAHILESILRIEEFTHNQSKSDFLKSVQIQDAVIRRLEVIGEAAKNLSKSFVEDHKLVPWNEMAKMRDKLIHGYFGVDLDITWNVVKDDLPEIKKKIEKLLSKR